MHTRSKRYLRRKRGKMRAAQRRSTPKRTVPPPDDNALASHIAVAMQKAACSSC
jgi:hypothetical protein